MKQSLFLLLAVCAVSKSLPYKSSYTFPENLDSRIIQGWPAAKGQFPYQVHLRMITTTGGMNACGGSIIHPQWILTAAHCLTNKNAVFVRYGAQNVTKPELILESTNFYIHPDYNSVSLNHDIGLINVGRHVEETETINVIKMPGSNEVNVTYAGEVSTASGYGRTVVGGPSSEILRYVNLTIVTNEFCSNYYSIIINSTICAVGIESAAQSTCHGDSGGALVVYDNNRLPILVGVVSFVSSLGCDSGSPSGYVRPQFYHDWMTNVTGIKF